MTLATRVIGVLLVDGGTGQLVHREHFKTLYPRNPPVTQARIYAARSMDEILMFDVTATEQGREPDYELISDVVGGSFLPISYGGGITSAEQAVHIVAECGADKVVLRPAAGARLALDITDLLGAQAVVLSIEHPRVSWWGCEDWPIGEILLQSLDRDGTLSGYDLDLIRAGSKAVSIPVIASSGCGKPSDMVEAMRAGADAVAAGWMWDATDVTPSDCKAALAAAGYVVRPVA